MCLSPHDQSYFPKGKMHKSEFRFPTYGRDLLTPCAQPRHASPPLLPARPAPVPAPSGSVPCAATAAAALREPAPAPQVAELALSSFFQGHRTRRAQVRRQRVSLTSGSSSFGSTSHPNVRWSRGLRLCRAFVRDASPARVLSDPPQIPAPVRAALATSQPVQQVGPIVPTDQLLYSNSLASRRNSSLAKRSEQSRAEARQRAARDRK